MTLLADTALPFNAPSFAYAKLQALMYCDTVAGDDALVIVHNSGQTTVLSDAVTIGQEADLMSVPIICKDLRCLRGREL